MIRIDYVKKVKTLGEYKSLKKAKIKQTQRICLQGNRKRTIDKSNHVSFLDFINVYLSFQRPPKWKTMSLDPARQPRIHHHHHHRRRPNQMIT